MRQNRADILRERYGKLQKQNEINVSGPLYIYENHKKHDFSLPKKSICGQQLIGPGRRFKGDSYFMMFVKTGDLRIHEVLEITKDNAKQPAGDVLLVENPMAGIDIIS